VLGTCFQPLSVHGWTWAFLLAVHRLCGAIERRLSHFLPHWLRMCWQSVSSRGKISPGIQATTRTDSKTPSFLHQATMTDPWNMGHLHHINLLTIMVKSLLTLSTGPGLYRAPCSAYNGWPEHDSDRMCLEHQHSPGSSHNSHAAGVAAA